MATPIHQSASVDVENTATGVHQSTKTNETGVFGVLSLNPGVYQVNISKEGFDGYLPKSVTVGAAQTATLDVSLSVGKTSEVTVVSAQAALLSKDISDVATTVDYEIVESIPVPVRGSLEATLLATPSLVAITSGCRL
jgi:hypothetical protein